MAILDEPIKGMPFAKNCINGEWVVSKGDQILTLTAALAEEV